MSLGWWPRDQRERTKPLEGTSMTETRPHIKRPPASAVPESLRSPKPLITPTSKKCTLISPPAVTPCPGGPRLQQAELAGDSRVPLARQ